MIECSSQEHHPAKATQLLMCKHGACHLQRLQLWKEKSMNPCFCFWKDHLLSNSSLSGGKNDHHTLHDPLPSGCANKHIKQSLQSKVFTAGTCGEQIQLIKSCAGGCGHKALPAIIQLDHPMCRPHPNSLFSEGKPIGKKK